MRAIVLGALVGVLVGLWAPARAQPAPDLERARELYKSAETAMRDARYADAIHDYGAAYEITKDPAFFYKIGSANERSGNCDVAVIYYRRYLKEARPTEEFSKLTTARIAACGGTVEPGSDPAKPSSGDPAKPGTGTGTAPAPALEPGPGAGSAAPAPAPALGRHRGPWLLVGSAIAFVTVGAVLAYSADAAERDVEDLYVGLNGTPPPFNDTTRKRYDDAIAEGRRYQTLSIATFGVAGAFAAGAAIWFALDRKPEKLTVAPAVAPGTAGVSTTIRF